VISGTVPALGDKRVDFRVYFVNPAGDYATWRATRQSSGYDIKSFEVRARPVAATPDLRPGMSVLFDSVTQ
jgi:HlyD family secretion protein